MTFSFSCSILRLFFDINLSVSFEGVSAKVAIWALLLAFEKMLESSMVLIAASLGEKSSGDWSES